MRREPQTLEEMRDEIASIDEQLMPLLARRGELILRIGVHKREHYDGTPLAPEHYDEMLQRARTSVPDPRNARWMEHIFRTLAREYEELEMSEAERRHRAHPPGLRSTA